jgi:hypothetical protein
MPTMPLSELRAMLAAEKADALAAVSASKLSTERADAMDYYVGEMSRDNRKPTAEDLRRAAAVRTRFRFSCSCRLRGAGDRSTASLLAHALIDAILIRRGRPLKPSGATRIAESMHGFGGVTPGGDPHCGSGCCRSSDRLSLNIALRVRECGRAEDECPQRCGQHDATRMLDEAEARRCRHGRDLRAR